VSGPSPYGDEHRDPRGARTSVSGTPMPVDVSHDRRARGTWVVFVGGPIVWFTHFMVVYLAAEAGCTGDGPGLQWFDPPATSFVILAATTAAAIASLGLGVSAHRRWRGSNNTSARGTEHHDHEESHGERSMAFVGLLLATLSFVTIVAVGMPAAIFRGC
jgi:hypothetical protein